MAGGPSGGEANRMTAHVFVAFVAIVAFVAFTAFVALRLRTEDLEVETLHYRGGHAAAKAASGFTRSSGSTMRVVSSRGTGGGAGGRGRRIDLGITARAGERG